MRTLCRTVLVTISFMLSLILSSCGDDNRQNTDFVHVAGEDNRENYDFDRRAKALSWEVKRSPIDLRVIPKFLSSAKYTSFVHKGISTRTAIYCDYLGRTSSGDDPCKTGTLIILAKDDVKLDRLKESIGKALTLTLVKNKIYAVFFASDTAIVYTVLAEDIKELNE